MEQLQEMLERCWPLSGVDIGKLQDSSGSDVYLLKANQGTFMLKLLSASIDSERANHYTFVLDYLDRFNFPAPKVLALRDGRLFAKWEDRCVYVLHYIEGRTIEENEREEYELGRVASRLHRITDYPYKTSLVTREALLSSFNESHMKAVYEKVFLSLPDFSKDKRVLIHTDLCPQNALWTADDKLVLIDFDDAGMGARSLDIGYPLLCQFIDYEGRLPMQAPRDGAKLYFKESIAKAFYSGYFADSKPDRHEKELIFSGAIYRMLQELTYLPPEAIDFRWKHIQYALDNRDVIMRTM